MYQAPTPNRRCCRLPTADTNKQAHKRLEKVNDNHKRKFAELQTSLKQRLVETEQKMAKLDSKAGKARKVEGLLKQFL